MQLPASQRPSPREGGDNQDKNLGKSELVLYLCPQQASLGQAMPQALVPAQHTPASHFPRRRHRQACAPCTGGPSPKRTILTVSRAGFTPPPLSTASV